MEIGKKNIPENKEKQWHAVNLGDCDQSNRNNRKKSIITSKSSEK